MNSGEKSSIKDSNNDKKNANHTTRKTDSNLSTKSPKRTKSISERKASKIQVSISGF